MSGKKPATNASPTNRMRARYLETLLDRLTAPADISRQHLALQKQAVTLGLGAEIGVRELLSLILPRRLAVTSGFIRSLGFDIDETTPAGEVSPQTDVIVHDATYSVPLHSLGGVEVLAAPDVLAVFEVKDTERGSDELGPEDKKALPHIARIARFTRLDTLRGVVLFQGSQDTSKTEIARARENFEAVERWSFQIPHVVYCTSYSNASDEGSYVAFHDALARSVEFHEHMGEPTASLASFLRIITGFFAIQGLISPALHLDLRATKPTNVAPSLLVKDALRPFDKLHERLAGPNVSDYEQPFTKLLEDPALHSVFCHITTGMDGDHLPTAGVLVQVQWLDTTIAAAFFYLTAPGRFSCTDAASATPWTIEGERVDVYVKRLLDKKERVHLFNQAFLLETSTSIQAPTSVAAAGANQS